MSLGNTLRAAREACGITTSELAARTHMLVQIVEGLENEDFRRIPAPIYGRGFIKLYCEAVNIDPKPLQAEFMELFNKPKNAPAVVAPPPPARQTPPPPPLDPQPVNPAESALEQAPIEGLPSGDEAGDASETETEEQASVASSPVQEPPSMAEFGELFAQPAASLSQPPPIRRPEVNSAPDPVDAPPKRSYGELFETTYAAEEPSGKTSAAEKFRNTMSNVSSGVFANVQKLPPNTGRIIAVSICALVTLSLIGWGVFELYKATTPVSGEDAAVPAESANVAGAETSDTKPLASKALEKPPKKVEPKNALAPETKKQETKKNTSVKPTELKSSGIEVPPLYID